MTSLRDVIDAVLANGATVPPEVAAFVALEVAETVAGRPTRIAPVFVEVSDEGAVHVASTAKTTEVEAVRDLGRLLAEMVGGPASVVPPGLEEIVRRTGEPGPAGYPNLDGLRADLEGYLVPLNRGAARRVLSRFLREVSHVPAVRAGHGARVGGEVELAPGLDLESAVDDALPLPVASDDVDDLLKDLEEPAQAAPQRQAPVEADVDAILEELATDSAQPRPDEADSSVDSLLQQVQTFPMLEPPSVGVDTEPQPLQPPAAPKRPEESGYATPRLGPPPKGTEPLPPPVAVAPLASPAPAAASPVSVEAKSVEASASAQRPATGSAPLVLPDVTEAKPRRGFGLLIVTVVLLLAALFAVLYQSRPEIFGGEPATGSAGSPRSGQPDEAVLPPRIDYGTLTVTSEPTGAEVLLFVGRGPVEVTHLPVGVAHEFVVISDDDRVARAVVPADAPFAPRRDGPDPVSTELAIQLPQGEPASGVWPGTELPPGAPGEGTGQLGTVRVVTNPLGARVYLLVGFTPTAPISNLRLDEAYDLLVVKAEHERERIVVGRSDWRRDEESGDFTFEVSVTLRPLEPASSGSRRRR